MLCIESRFDKTNDGVLKKDKSSELAALRADKKLRFSASKKITRGSQSRRRERDEEEEEEEEDERDGEVDKHGGFRVRDRQGSRHGFSDNPKHAHFSSISVLVEVVSCLPNCLASFVMSNKHSVLMTIRSGVLSLKTTIVCKRKKITDFEA
ncbi:hypothetical protein YC2023_123022 [Brassica napus]